MFFPDIFEELNETTALDFAFEWIEEKPLIIHQITNNKTVHCNRKYLSDWVNSFNVWFFCFAILLEVVNKFACTDNKQ